MSFEISYTNQHAELMELQTKPVDYPYEKIQEEIAFFHEMKRELGIQSTKKLASLIRKIFSGIRRTLTAQETDAFINSMPDLLRLLFVSGWRYEKESRIDHLDELVESIYYEDRLSLRPVFRSEIEALNAVVVVLRKLDKIWGVLNFNGFKFSLVQEIRQVA